MVSVLSMLGPQKCSLLLALASVCLFVRLRTLPVCLLVGSVSQAQLLLGIVPRLDFLLGRLAFLTWKTHSPGVLLTLLGGAGTARVTTQDDFRLH